MAVVSRRAALVAGVAVLVGCGKDDAAAPPEEPSAAEALLRALAAQRAAAAATGAARARRPPGDPQVRVAAARASERAQRLAAAVSAAGGRPHDAPQPAGGDGEPDTVLAAHRAALEAQVAALPSLRGDQRRLAATLIEGSAADLAILGAEFGEARAEAFPGQPS